MEVSETQPSKTKQLAASRLLHILKKLQNFFFVLQQQQENTWPLHIFIF